MKKHLSFGPALARSILSGEKTQSRRLITPQPDISLLSGIATGRELSVLVADAWDMGFIDVPCPYGKPGHTLSLNEPWAAPSNRAAFLTRDEIVFHEGSQSLPDLDASMCWRGDQVLPPHLARAVLTLTDARVERLHEISDEDCFAEGVQKHHGIVGVACYGGPPVELHGDVYFAPTDEGDGEGYETPQDAFRAIWNSLPGHDWDDNPFVWVLSFSVEKSI